MDASDRARVEMAFAEAALALTALEVTLATLRDNGVVISGQIAEIVLRLQGLVETFRAEPESQRHRIADTMAMRLDEMATYLGVDLHAR
jgi:hypothetical protein